MTQCRNVGDIQQTSLSTWKWTMRNYSDYLATGKTAVLSPNFSALHHNDITNWRFEVYPNDEDEKNNKFLTVLLTNLDEADTTASCVFSILNQTNDVVYERKAFPQEIFSKLDVKSRGISHFVSHEFLNDESNHALTDNTLTLQFRFLVGPKYNVVSNNIEDDFEVLLDSLKYSDVTLIVEEKKLYLHKSMLAARSPVFAAMFQYNMQENRENTVRITDVKFNVVREMCHYMYVGKVNDISSVAKDLLIAADKYCMDDLKLLCEKTVCDQLNIDNAVGYLQLALMYNAEYLKLKVSKFIKTYIKDIYVKKDFKKLDREITDVILGIIIGFYPVE